MSVKDEEMRAIRLIRLALDEGFTVSLYPEDDLSDPLHKDSTDYEALKADVHACDMMSIVIRQPMAGAQKGPGAWFLLIFGNGDDGPISDYTDNEIGNRFFNEVMPALD